MHAVEISAQGINREDPIKVCPWCGQKPYANELSWGGVSIRCANAGCRMRPETGWCDSAAEALTIWNKRTP